MIERAEPAPAVAEEFPGLALYHLRVEGGSGPSPRGVRERLDILGDRFTGARALQLRNQPIPWAYRVFFRHIGIDPDLTRTPVEALALARLQDGAFVSRNLLDDALSLATIETGVAVIAFDADRIGTELSLRGAGPDERIEGEAAPLSPGTLLIVDRERPLAVLFGDLADGRGVANQTTAIRLVAIAVEGVPAIAISEALWLVAELIKVGPDRRRR